MTETVIKVKKTCCHCTPLITKALVYKSVKGLGGIQKVDVRLERNEVAVAFDEVATPLKKIETAIIGVGFEIVRAKSESVFSFYKHPEVLGFFNTLTLLVSCYHQAALS